ncbi:MAG: hypothetical protein B6240_13360 [Desulfobacteraceae bacterium 4572_87]|nr:MAG: hypothetical protein B6240_13360 [Desulfobacteraceae bacterium 4572_87]
MARVDDYIKAVEIGKNELMETDPEQIAAKSGAVYVPGDHGNAVLSLDFLNKKIDISWPELVFSYNGDGGEVPIQQQVLLLHYLNLPNHVKTSGEWIAYQEVPDGMFYLDAFVRRAKNPMVQGFGDNPELLVKLTTEVYDATPLDLGDVAVAIQALPLIPVALILWKGDDEFPPEGTILFDRTVSQLLSAEDIAWLAGMIIYPLLGMAYKK